MKMTFRWFGENSDTVSLQQIKQIPINDLPRIYESLLLRAKVSQDPEGLIETARTALGPALAAQYVSDNVLRVIMIDPALEQSMLEALRPSDQGSQILLDPNRIETVLASLRAAVSGAENAGFNAVLVCAPALRPAIRRLVSAQAGGLPVLSYQEATAGNVSIETVGVVRGTETISA